jgi:predicted nucleotidyltransferase component of viral defense system
MKKRNLKDMASSVRNRLLEIARRKNRPFEEILVLYALERFLFRLSQSAHKDQFILKGGLLLYGMELSEARPTRDIDFLGLTQNNIEAVSEMIQGIGKIDFDDGMNYDFGQLTHETMAPDSEYPGIRLKFVGKLGKAKIPMRIDIGFGDAVVPDAKDMVFPTLLDMKAPTILAYAIETIIAEKFEAALDLADLNSRMKDFYDLWVLSQKYFFAGRSLQEAIIATCNKRGTVIRSNAEIFSPEFSQHVDKKTQWAAFINKGPMNDAPNDFSRLMIALHDFLLPVAMACESRDEFKLKWPPGGPWHD